MDILKNIFKFFLDSSSVIEEESKESNNDDYLTGKDKMSSLELEDTATNSSNYYHKENKLN